MGGVLAEVEGALPRATTCAASCRPAMLEAAPRLPDTGTGVMHAAGLLRWQPSRSVLCLLQGQLCASRDAAVHGEGCLTAWRC